MSAKILALIDLILSSAHQSLVAMLAEASVHLSSDGWLESQNIQNFFLSSVNLGETKNEN